MGGLGLLLRWPEPPAALPALGEGRLAGGFSPEQVVDACLLLHHLEAWHLADPPVLRETAMRLRFDPDATIYEPDLRRSRRYHEHQIALARLAPE